MSKPKTRYEGYSRLEASEDRHPSVTIVVLFENLEFCSLLDILQLRSQQFLVPIMRIT